MTARRGAAVTAYQALARARDALDRAVASGKADPWRVAELRLRHDRALARALDAGPDAAPDDGPRCVRPEPELPLSWVDESCRPLRRGGGSC